MGTNVDIPLPPLSIVGGKDEWAVLVSDVLAVQAGLIIRGLEGAGIASRVITHGQWITILVRVVALESALFVLAKVAFDQPATMEAPLAETGHGKWARPVGKFVATVAAVITSIVVVGSAFLPRNAHALECPDGHSVMAPRGGCLETTDDF